MVSSNFAPFSTLYKKIPQMKSLVKRLSFVAIYGLLTLTVVAQKDVPKGWHLLNPKDSGNYYGISLAQAYDFIKSKKLKSTSVLVAVIDSGVDTLHEDLKAI